MQNLNEIKEFIIAVNPKRGMYDGKAAERTWELAMRLLHRVEECESTLSMLALMQGNDASTAIAMKEMAVRRLND